MPRFGHSQIHDWIEKYSNTDSACIVWLSFMSKYLYLRVVEHFFALTVIQPLVKFRPRLINVLIFNLRPVHIYTRPTDIYKMIPAVNVTMKMKMGFYILPNNFCSCRPTVTLFCLCLTTRKSLCIS